MSGLGTLNERKQTLESYLYAEKALKSLGQSPDVSEQRANGACSGRVYRSVRASYSACWAGTTYSSKYQAVASSKVR